MTENSAISTLGMVPARPIPIDGARRGAQICLKHRNQVN
jgi:hypothetical protein